MAYTGYESAGTFTPTIQFGGGSTGLSYASQYGNWVRTGTQVFITGGVSLSAIGTSFGDATFGGLPFQVAPYSFPLIDIWFIFFSSASLALTGGYWSQMGISSDIGTGGYFYECNGTNQVNLTNSNFSSSTGIAFTGVYQTLP